MSDSITIKFDSSVLDKALDQVVKKSESAIRPAAQAGAQRLYMEAKMRCPVSETAHYFYGTSYKKTGTKYYFAPGSLRDSIYQVYSKDNSGQQKATYHIAWNHQKVPYGFMVEFGTSKMPAHPFLRPAYEAAKDMALQDAQTVFAERFNGAEQ